MTDEFEPRSAKSADLEEITFTGTRDVAWSPGDEIPPGAEIIDVTGSGDRKLVARQMGVQRTIRAKDGVFHPRDAEEKAALDAYGLPVARQGASSDKSGAPDSKGG